MRVVSGFFWIFCGKSAFLDAEHWRFIISARDACKPFETAPWCCAVNPNPFKGLGWGGWGFTRKASRKQHLSKHTMIHLHVFWNWTDGWMAADFPFAVIVDRQPTYDRKQQDVVWNRNLIVCYNQQTRETWFSEFWWRKSGEHSTEKVFMLHAALLDTATNQQNQRGLAFVQSLYFHVLWCLLCLASMDLIFICANFRPQ